MIDRKAEGPPDVAVVRKIKWSPLEPDADAFVRKRLQLDLVFGVSPTEMAAEIHRFAIEVGKATRRQHLEALATAYAMHIVLQARPDSRPAIMAIAKDRGIPVRENTDPLRVLLSTVIHYGEDKPGDARKLYSRDVAALNFMASEGVSPQDLEERADEPGEGLDQWARRWAKRKKELSGAEPPPKVKLTRRSLKIHYRSELSAFPGSRRIEVADPAFGPALARLLKRFKAKPMPPKDRS